MLAAHKLPYPNEIIFNEALSQVLCKILSYKHHANRDNVQI